MAINFFPWQFQVPVTLPIMIERPTGAKPPSFLKPIIVDEKDEGAPIRQVDDVQHKMAEDLMPPMPLFKPMVILN